MKEFRKNILRQNLRVMLVLWGLGWLTLMSLNLGLYSKVRAQEDNLTPTSKEEPTIPPEASDEESDKLNTEVKEKVSQRLQNIVYRKVALVGTLSEVTDDSLTMSVNGSQLQAKSSEETVYLDQRKGDREIKKDDLELGETVIIMGWQKADEELVDARRVVEIESLTKLERQVVTGEIQEVAKRGTSFILIETGTNQEWEISLEKSGQVVSQSEGEIGEVDWDEVIEEGRKVIVLSVMEVKAEETEGEVEEESDANETIEARLIYVYPLPPTPTITFDDTSDATGSGTTQTNTETETENSGL